MRVHVLEVYIPFIADDFTIKGTRITPSEVKKFKHIIKTMKPLIEWENLEAFVNPTWANCHESEKNFASIPTNGVLRSMVAFISGRQFEILNYWFDFL